jgi:pimeloyl-ACP methyl ester carboxylesterase
MIRESHLCSSVFICGLLAFFIPPAAADGLVNLDTRPGVRVGYWWMERPDAAAAIALGNAVEGLVLTSSITDASLPGAVRNMALAEVRVPVLVMHHRRDECKATPPGPMQSLMDAFVNAPVKRIVVPAAP